MGKTLNPAAFDLPEPPAWVRFVPPWLRSLIWLDSALKYDAFLSYSWQFDGEIAPVIQRLIHRFLRPWYKALGKAVFRDLSCLPAGSSLEQELFDRLDRSTHLIVLANPAAARSRGMELEGAYWFSRPRDGEILIIVTGGEWLEWEDIRTRLPPPRSPEIWSVNPFGPDPGSSRRNARQKDHCVLTLLEGQITEDLRQILLRFYLSQDWSQLRGKKDRNDAAP